MKIALVTFSIDAMNVRALSAYLRRSGHIPYLIFFLSQPSSDDVAILTELLKWLDVELIGISLVTDDYAKATAITLAVKNRLRIPVIWGGAHPSICPEECLRSTDMVCIGEGEEALVEVCNAMESNQHITDIENIWFRYDKKIYKKPLRTLIEDLDTLPFIDYELGKHFVINEGRWRQFDEGMLRGHYHIMTTRGCPFSCSYCYNNQRRKLYAGKGRYLRQRSVDNIIAELSWVKANLKSIKVINFWDDIFLATKLDTIKYFSERYKKEIGMPFFCLGNPSLCNEQKISLLKSCGLTQMQVGIQTGSERVNYQVYNRHISNAKMLDVATLLHKHGIAASYDFIFNNPYETETDIQETIELLLKFPQPLSIQGYNLTFYPGSDIYDRALADGFISDDSINESATIQSPTDTPLKSFESSSVSNRFYRCNFSYENKRYFNILVSLLPYYPAVLIKFLLRFRHDWLIALLTKPFMLRQSAPKIATFIGKAVRLMKRWF
ncbi:MAG: B12-binding domain-containing radical SAM protein [Candidatus Aminicenantes bacterium]|nr:MAG: B12-binding domain-containing radical SAM protein [Candidatus Aminicenantes bacterium]